MPGGECRLPPAPRPLTGASLHLGSQRGRRGPGPEGSPEQGLPRQASRPGSGPRNLCCFSAGMTLVATASPSSLSGPRVPGGNTRGRGSRSQTLGASTVLSLQICRDGPAAGNLAGAKTQAISMKCEEKNLVTGHFHSCPGSGAESWPHLGPTPCAARLSRWPLRPHVPSFVGNHSPKLEKDSNNPQGLAAQTGITSCRSSAGAWGTCEKVRLVLHFWVGCGPSGLHAVPENTVYKPSGQPGGSRHRPEAAGRPEKVGGDPALARPASGSELPGAVSAWSGAGNTGTQAPKPRSRPCVRAFPEQSPSQEGACPPMLVLEVNSP